MSEIIFVTFARADRTLGSRTPGRALRNCAGLSGEQARPTSVSRRRDAAAGQCTSRSAPRAGESILSILCGRAATPNRRAAWRSRTGSTRRLSRPSAERPETRRRRLRHDVPYMAALSASRFNPDMKKLFDWIQGRGKGPQGRHRRDDAQARRFRQRPARPAAPMATYGTSARCVKTVENLGPAVEKT